MHRCLLKWKDIVRWIRSFLWVSVECWKFWFGLWRTLYLAEGKEGIFRHYVNLYLFRIIFEELEVPSDPNTKKNGKELVYKHFVGELFINDGAKTEIKDFEFDIHNYFQEAEYDIRIDKHHNILVRDSKIE